MHMYTVNNQQFLHVLYLHCFASNTTYVHFVGSKIPHCLVSGWIPVEREHSLGDNSIYQCLLNVVQLVSNTTATDQLETERS